MNCSRFLSTILLGLVSCIISFAQIMTPFKSYGDLTPSVNSYEMGRYGDFDHSLYTGAMSYDINLYTYKDLDVTIPITLHYYYDGYKPSSYSGELGLGWSMHVGGVITREVIGVPDEGGFNSNDEVPIQGYWEATQNDVCIDPTYIIRNSRLDEETFGLNWPETGGVDHIFDPYRDVPCFYKGGWYFETTPDVFHFDVAGMKGDFSLQPDGTIAIYNSNVPVGELQINFNCISAPQHHQYLNITITSGDGTRYIFGETSSANEYAEFADEYTQDYGASSDEGNLSITAVKLSRIIPPNQRQILFHYSDSTLSSTSAYTSQHNHVTQCYYRAYSIQLSEDLGNVCSAQRQYYNPIDSISVDGKAFAHFTYSPKTFDECDSQYYEYGLIDGFFLGWFPPKMNPCCLSRISIENNAQQEVEAIQFIHSYAAEGTPKMFLDSLKILSNGCYTFRYFSRDTLPAPDTKCTDYWGFWNDTPMNFYSLKQTNHSQLDQFSDSRIKKPSFLKTKKGALSSIVFPTGGESTIEYEGNDATSYVSYGLLQVPSICSLPDTFSIGGLRVQSVSTISNGDTTTVHYEYKQFDNNYYSSGRLMYLPLYLLRHHYGYFMGGTTGNFTQNSYVLGIRANLSKANYVEYSTVIKTFDDGSFNVYDFYSTRDYQDNYTPYQIGDFKLKTAEKHIYRDNDHYILDVNDPDFDGIAGVCCPVMDDYSCIRGKLKSERQYDTTGFLRHKKEYEYSIEITAASDYIWFNNVENFLGIRKKYRSANLTRQEEREFFPSGGFLSSETVYDLNPLGQITRNYYHKGPNIDTTSEIVLLQYASTAQPSLPPGLISMAIKIVSCRDSLFLTGAEKYDYNSDGNPHPKRITRYFFSSPIALPSESLGFNNLEQASSIITSDFSYDSLFRLIRSDFSGGAYITYEWDGCNIISKTKNGSPNTTLFDWKDLVGVTGITSPSGQSESFLYDERNHLWKSLDGDGHIVNEFQIHFMNE